MPGACVQCSPIANSVGCDGNGGYTCVSGYYYSSAQGRCNACGLDCVTCSPVTLACTKCSFGHVLTAVGTCIECLGTCQVCSTADVSQCLGCGPGYYWTQNSTTVSNNNNNNSYYCAPCMPGCSSCVNPDYCTACRTGYFFDMATGKCVSNCPFPCSSCSNNICQSCVGGYSLVGTTCVPDTQCTATNSCTSCPAGYVIQYTPATVSSNNNFDYYGICIACQTPSTCYQCSSSNLAVCVRCNFGYSLINGQCSLCGSQCSSCAANMPGYCASCIDGYYMVG